jgi:hypothetical protein
MERVNALHHLLGSLSPLSPSEIRSYLILGLFNHFQLLAVTDHFLDIFADLSKVLRLEFKHVNPLDCKVKSIFLIFELLTFFHYRLCQKFLLDCKLLVIIDSLLD